MDAESQSPSSAPCRREEASNENLSSHDTSYDERGAILECVLNDLHSSAKLALVHYFENLVDEEVKEVVDFPQESHMNEVICESLSFYVVYTLFT